MSLNKKRIRSIARSKSVDPSFIEGLQGGKTLNQQDRYLINLLFEIINKDKSWGEQFKHYLFTYVQNNHFPLPRGFKEEGITNANNSINMQMMLVNIMYLYYQVLIHLEKNIPGMKLSAIKELNRHMSTPKIAARDVFEVLLDSYYQ